MHENSHKIMDSILKQYLGDAKGLTVLDVGSGDVNGTYKAQFVARGCVCTGIDIAPGRNVDIVMPHEDRLPESPQYDWVVSGQCFEHAKHPWLLAAEMARVCKPGGIVVIIAPWKWITHRYPIDCWRISPDGMRVLLEWGKCEVLDTNVSVHDCYGVGRKPL